MSRRRTAFAARDRCRNDIGELCRSGVEPAALLDGVLGHLRTQVDFDAAFIAATDPATTLFSQAGAVENLPLAMCAPWLDNEFIDEDFNKFADLHRGATGPTTLHRSTFDRPERSVRYRELNTAHGFGPELRATFSVDGECWGAINLLRAADDSDFDADDIAFIGSIGELVARGIRRFVLGASIDSQLFVGPGVVMLDSDGAVLSMTDQAMSYLDEFSSPAVEHLGTTLPGEAYVVGARARARAAGLPGAAPITRTRTRSGQWLTMHADCSRDADGDVVATVIVIEPSRSSEMMPMFVAAHGLSPREEAVLAELVKGATTTETARALHISPHTVRDHVKSLHDKVGVRSRGELISQLYRLHYAPDLAITHRQ